MEAQTLVNDLTDTVLAPDQTRSLCKPSKQPVPSKPDAVVTPNIADSQQNWVSTGQDFSAGSGPSGKTDPATREDGLSRSCQRWRSPHSLVGGIVCARRPWNSKDEPQLAGQRLGL